MKDSQRMQPVSRVAQSRERDAARRMGKDMHQVEQQQQQLDQLIAYREQYIASYQTAGKAGFTVTQMREYQIFISRLNDAIAQQRQQLIACRQTSEKSSSSWRDSRSHSKKIDKVVEQRICNEQREQRGREQREQDDRRIMGPLQLDYSF
jgi:flagellar FliJ protein